MLTPNRINSPLVLLLFSCKRGLELHTYVSIASYRQKFSPGENFRQFPHLLSLAKFLAHKFLSCFNDYIEDMVTFTALVKNYSAEYFCNTKVHVAELGEIFVKRNFHIYGIKLYAQLVLVEHSGEISVGN